jgi:hypothetical protein
LPPPLEELEWIVAHDHTPRIVATALKPILESRTPDGSATLVRIVTNSLGGAATVTSALVVLDERGVALAPDVINRYLRSHRPRIRTAAGRHAKRARMEIPPAPEGTAWFETDGAKTIIAGLARLVGRPLQPPAQWVEVWPKAIISELEEEELPVSDRGWLLQSRPDLIEIETPTGYVRRIWKHGFVERNKVEKLDDQSWRVHELRHEAEYRYRTASAADEVKRVLALRASMEELARRPRPETRPSSPTFSVRTDSDPPDPRALRGTLSEWLFDEPFEYSLYEVLLGYRLYQTGDRDDAAKILARVIDATPDDDDLLYFVEWHLGCALGHRMVARFMEHDITATLDLARRIASDFPRSHFKKLARQLIGELPRRSQDWSDFRIPSPSEWEGIASNLNRDEQIRYLCDRGRLVTDAHAGIIQGWPWDALQTRDAGYANHRGTWVSTGWTPVINPLLVLKEGPLAARLDGTGGTGIDAQDFELLRSCAQDSWLAPCVSAWRAFHHDRVVRTSGDLIRMLIDHVTRSSTPKPESR